MAKLEDIRYDLLPEHIREGARNYIEAGILPGGFMQAVLRNDLQQAIIRADKTNRDRIFDIVSFFINEVPRQCWGSRENVKAWVEKHGRTYDGA